MSERREKWRDRRHRDAKASGRGWGMETGFMDEQFRQARASRPKKPMAEPDWEDSVGQDAKRNAEEVVRTDAVDAAEKTAVAACVLSDAAKENLRRLGEGRMRFNFWWKPRGKKDDSRIWVGECMADDANEAYRKLIALAVRPHEVRIANGDADERRGRSIVVTPVPAEMIGRPCDEKNQRKPLQG